MDVALGCIDAGENGKMDKHRAHVIKMRSLGADVGLRYQSLKEIDSSVGIDTLFLHPHHGVKRDGRCDCGAVGVLQDSLEGKKALPDIERDWVSQFGKPKYKDAEDLELKNADFQEAQAKKLFPNARVEVILEDFSRVERKHDNFVISLPSEMNYEKMFSVLNGHRRATKPFQMLNTYVTQAYNFQETRVDVRIALEYLRIPKTFVTYYTKHEKQLAHNYIEDIADFYLPKNFSVSPIQLKLP